MPFMYNSLSISLFISLILAVLPLQADYRHLYPHGDILPIGGYSGNPEEDAQNGFTLAGPTYGRDTQAFLERAAQAELPLMYPIRVDLDFHGKQGDPPTELNVESIQQEIRNQVLEVMDSPWVFAWYLMPEELRSWRPLELQYLQIAYQTIKETDTENRPVWMYEPGHRTAAALAKLLPWLDISGKGMYTNYSSRMEERIWTRWTMEQQNEAIAIANPNAQSIAVPEMFQQPPPDKVADIPVWVRHDAYSSMVNGAEAIVIFSLAKRRNFAAHQDYYNAWAAVARELTNPDLPLGTVFLRGTELPDPALKITSGPETVTLSVTKTLKEPVTYPSLQVKRMEWEGNEYLFLINSTNGPLQVDLNETGWSTLDGAAARNLSFSRWQVHVLKK